MKNRVGPGVPGNDVASTDNTGYTNFNNFGELTANAPYTIYNELFFHDNQNHVNWFGTFDGVRGHAWRYGWAVDALLGYP